MERLVMTTLGILLLAFASLTGALRGPASADKIPANVMTTLTARFPQAKIDKWSKEKEDGKEVYDIEFKQDGRKFEADIFADGTIHNWEQQIAPGDLPAPVRQTLARQFPKASLKEVMAITEVKSGREELQGYEIVVQRVFRDVEVTIAPDGRVLEGPSKQK
jgi:hypothetical protein